MPKFRRPGAVPAALLRTRPRGGGLSLRRRAHAAAHGGGSRSCRPPRRPSLRCGGRGLRHFRRQGGPGQLAHHAAVGKPLTPLRFIRGSNLSGSGAPGWESAQRLVPMDGIIAPWISLFSASAKNGGICAKFDGAAVWSRPTIQKADPLPLERDGAAFRGIRPRCPDLGGDHKMTRREKRPPSAAYRQEAPYFSQNAAMEWLPVPWPCRGLTGSPASSNWMAPV